MIRACPYCGSLNENVEMCKVCNKNIKWLDSLNHKSEVYYTKAYYYAKQRELTKAVPLLKKAIALNAYHIEAKNLLGLIYFEMGSVGEALKLWILSQSLKKEGNEAQRYIEMIQKDLKKFERYKEAAELYNKSLTYLKQKNEDMAVIRLKKAVKLNENFIEAKNLLALAYIYQKQFYKAMEQLNDTLKIDKVNTKALYYLNLIHREETVIETPLLNNPNEPLISYRPQKVINRGHILKSAVIYFVFGALCMLAVQVTIIVPSKTESLEKQIYDLSSIKAESEKQFEMTRKETDAKILVLEEEIKVLKVQNEDLQKNNNKINQQNRLAQARSLASEQEWVQAAEQLYNISTAEFSAEDLKTYESLKPQVLEKAAQRLYDTGYSFYRQEKVIEATADFEKVVLYSPNTWVAGEALYYMAEMQEKTNVQKAKQHYTTLVNDYSGTKTSYKAQERLKKLGEQN